MNLHAASALDRPLPVTFFKNRGASEKQEARCSLRVLADRIRSTKAGKKDDLPWLKLAAFGDYRTDKNSLRHDGNVKAVGGIEADYDGGKIAFDRAVELLEQRGVAAVIYTSPSHTDARPRWRVLAPLSEDMPPEQRAHMVGRLNGLFQGAFATESFTLSQAYYFGAVNNNPAHRVELVDGTPIDLHDDLDAAWLGKPGTQGSSGNGHDKSHQGPLDEAAALGAIVSTKDFHTSAVRLAGRWAAKGISMLEAKRRLVTAFECVFPPDRDDRWRRRYADIDRCLADVYGKEANKRDKAEQQNSSAAAVATPPEFFDPWSDPPPPDLPCGILSAKMEDTVIALALRNGLCPGALAMAYLAAVSGAASKACRFTPYQNSEWTVPPIIWVMLIADSGQRKTAIEDLAFAPVRKVHAEIWHAHRKRLAEWQMLPTKERRETKKPEEPHSYIVEDTSPEKLQMILAASLRGTFMARDEMAGILEFGRYTGGKGAAERAFYLQAYEAGHYTVSRVSRDSLHVAINGLTIYGAIQPGRLADFPDLAKDGLIQRFNMIRVGHATLSRDSIDVQGVDMIDAAITELTRQNKQDYRTTPEGSDLIRQTEHEGRNFAAITDFGPGFQGTCNKLHGTHARYALVLHLLDDPDCAIIPAATIERAHSLVRKFLLPQARNFFENLPGSPAMKVRDAAGWILARAPTRFTASDVTKHVRAYRGIGTKELGEELDPLVTGGWLEPETPFPSNRAWTVHPQLRTAFTERAEAEHGRRAEVRAMLESMKGQA